MMNYKKSTKLYLIINLSVIISLTLGLVIYDPLHIFHKSWIVNENRFHNDMRLQAAGIINNYEFDSVIVGTSMLKGTPAILASDMLGGVFVNLSPNGASIAERKYLIQYALKQKEIKNVIISFDTGLDQNLIESNPKFPVTKFNYLYDDVLLNDFKAYWNYKFIGCLLSFSTSSDCYGSKRELQRPINWFSKIHLRNAKISGVENWVHAKGGRGKNIYARVNKHIEHPISSRAEFKEKLNLTRQIMDDSLFSIIKEHPNTHFHVIFPPYSRFLYALWRDKNPYKYELYIETIRYLVSKGATYNNLTTYSFDDMDYLNNLNNYRDMRHYNTDMNETMLASIADKKNVINVNNIEEFIALIDLKNSTYEIDEELNYLIKSYKR